jgi:hypothetical protein
VPGEPVVLDSFGGIVSIARPEDIPEGASPRCNDIDFLVGRFIQRPGLESVYTNVQTEFGPVTGSVAVDVDTEAMPWTTPENILLNDGSYAIVNLLGQASVNSVTIVAGGYYALTDTVTVTFSGTGSGATGTALLTVVTPSSGPQFKTVIGVAVTASGTYTGTITVAFTGAANPANDATGTVVPNTVGQISDNIRVTGFGFAVPSNYLVQGITVQIKGFADNATVNAQLVQGGVNVGAIQSIPLPTSNDFVQLGGSEDLWGATWNYSDIDAPNFGLEIWVNSPDVLAVSLDFVEITISGVPTKANFNGIVSAKLDQTDLVNIYLDANGLPWQEDVTNAPNVLALETTIPNATPGSYLKGLDAGGTAYMAFSDLTQGISQPLQYNGEWCDRITQVGPGQPPVFTPQQASGTTFGIVSITQHPANSDITDPGHLSCVLHSAGPGSTAPGNVITVYYSPSFFSGAPQPSAEDTVLDQLFNAGVPTYVYISGSTFADGTYLVTSVGNALPPGLDHFRYYFTVQTSPVAFQKIVEDTGQYQMSIATLTTSVPVPGLVVGNTVTIAGASVPAWDAQWPIVQAINSGEMVITGTSVTGSVATYNYSIVSGTAPAAGELVTVTNTTNAGGLLNVTNATIVSASGGGTGTFTVAVSVTDAPSVPESGQATTAGTIFSIDPGPNDVPSTNPILGNSTGGTLTFSSTTTGQFITAGTKQASVFFITRNGAVTRPAPPATVVIPENCGSILVTQIPVGPPNVIARGITFTESGQNGVRGANFYYYDSPVTYTVNGVKFTSDALIVPDNTSSTATFSFSDSVLLASDEIDIPGNNYFNLIELGNPAWIFQYASRMLYGLCQTKIQNLLNMSFDGGYIRTLSTALPLPTGWSVINDATPGNYTVTGFSITANEVTVEAVNSLQPGYAVVIAGLTTGTYLNGIPLVVDSSNGTEFTASFSHADVGLTADSGTVTVTNSSVGLVPSLDFGNAFRITNYGSGEWTNPNILFQTAYQDYLGVNIIQPNVPYSVRVKARAIGTASQMVVQLPTYTNGAWGPAPLGAANFTFAEGGYQIQTATLLTGDGLATVPPKLVFALGVESLAPGAAIEIDRIEIFPTRNPVDTTTIWTSYANKFESVDIVTGSLGVGAENPQPATGAFEILEQLYITKTKSLQVTQDSPNYEPNNWQVRQASDRAGAVGPNAFNEGEEFSVMISRNGLYFFDGGKPMPISQELQSTGKGLNLWDALDWTQGSKFWIRNDLNNRRLTMGAVLPTPNFFLPNAPESSPTSPNVILMCNYTGCPTGEELAEGDQVHTTMFGDLKSLDMKRKWAIWQIVCPVAEFVPRQDGFTAPLFLCNGINSSKVYQLTNGDAVDGQNTDDGTPINWSYTTYAFVKAKQGQQLPGLGALRKVWYYLATTMEGLGKVRGKLYSNSLGALPRNTFTIPLDFTLSSPQQNDQERVIEIGGQRLFVEFTSLGSGGYAEVGPIMLDGEMDKNAPHRGVAS